MMELKTLPNLICNKPSYRSEGTRHEQLISFRDKQ